jgi:hypothetical protein
MKCVFGPATRGGVATDEKDSAVPKEVDAPQLHVDAIEVLALDVQLGLVRAREQASELEVIPASAPVATQDGRCRSREKYALFDE